MNWNWSDLLIIGGALTGVAFASDRWAIPDYDPRIPLPRNYDSAWAKVLLLGMYASIVALNADTPRGFLYLLLEPLGACLIFHVIADMLIGPRAMSRQRELIWKLERGDPQP